MEDGNGKLVDTFNTSFSSSFDQINVIAQGTLQFNDKIPSFTTSNIAAPFTTAATTVTGIKNNAAWDISDSTAKQHVTNIVGKGYTVGGTCDSTNVNGDAWMPSFELFACPGGKTKLSACVDLSSTVT